MIEKFTYILFILSTFSCFSQNIVEIDSVKMYLQELRAMHHFKDSYEHYFETHPVYLNEMFVDNLDLKTKIGSRKNEINPPSSKIIKSKVIFIFTNNTNTTLFFNRYGEYKYDGRWFRRHDDFYYLLFQHFSENIVPREIMKEVKLNYKGGIWEGE